MRQLIDKIIKSDNLFQSTHSLRSATRREDFFSYPLLVSIHALLAECDSSMISSEALICCFNPRTPCGVRQTSTPVNLASWSFQSTHSLRSATIFYRLPRRTVFSFNPRTPCGVRHRRITRHAMGKQFQSTHSLRSATIPIPFLQCPHRVSIHALLAECDATGWRCTPPATSFNPRTPCGVRLFGFTCFRLGIIVSIHALLAECDRISWPARTIPRRFNPRTPCGVRL